MCKCGVVICGTTILLRKAEIAGRAESTASKPLKASTDDR